MKNFTLLYIALSLLISSCGSDDSSSGSSPAVDNRAQETGVSTSYYVSSEKDLVACDSSRRGYLAYVKDTAEFKACLEAGWTTVDVKGKEGAKGSSGSNGAAGTMVSGNQWYDPITTKMWVMTNINTALTGFTDAQSTCSGTYRIPTQAEAQAALGHGMGTQSALLSSPPTYTVVSGYSSHGKVVRLSDAVFMTSGTGTGAQFCISQ